MQEVLRHWSKEQASEGDVSDVYVQIGHEFNAVIAAFAFHSIDLRCVGFYISPVCKLILSSENLSDLHTVPAELRVVLERCLSEDPAPEVLENSLPDLRKTLYRLLKGLQARREPWRVAAIRLANRSSSSTIETTSV